MSDFKKLHLDPAAPRTELHDALGLTGAEVSVNVLPSGAGVPFVHNHTANEEVYGIISGKGELYLDGKVSEVTAGDWFVITPEGRRALRAHDEAAGHDRDDGLEYIRADDDGEAGRAERAVEIRQTGVAAAVIAHVTVKDIF